MDLNDKPQQNQFSKYSTNILHCELDRTKTVKLCLHSVIDNSFKGPRFNSPPGTQEMFMNDSGYLHILINNFEVLISVFH